MKKEVYTKEMIRRLSHLYKRLDVYFKTGRDAGVAPALFSVLSYCWFRYLRKLVEHSDFLPVDDIVPSPGVNYVAGDNIVSDDLPF